jgi:hypothetical protein
LIPAARCVSFSRWDGYSKFVRTFWPADGSRDTPRHARTMGERYRVFVGGLPWCVGRGWRGGTHAVSFTIIVCVGIPHFTAAAQRRARDLPPPRAFPFPSIFVRPAAAAHS